MSAVEWKRGEFGMIDSRGWDALVVRLDHVWLAVQSGARLNPHLQPRPLVVIDPENREQVERLLILFKWPQPIRGHVLDDMQAALREFAKPTPPKPEEPTNLHAVVLDNSGHRWAHIGDGLWRSLTSTGPYVVEKRWDDSVRPLAATAVEVLSEGVTS